MKQIKVRDCGHLHVGPEWFGCICQYPIKRIREVRVWASSENRLAAQWVKEADETD